MPPVITVNGHVFETWHGDKEQAPWGAELGYSIKGRLQVTGAFPEVTEERDRPIGDTFGGTGQGTSTRATYPVEGHPWNGQ